MQDPRTTIVQYWHSEKVPADVARLIETFSDQNPNWRHQVFCEAKAEEFIVEHFTDREAAAFRSCGVPAMQADYFRYCAGLVLGGACSDVDFRCLQPLESLLASDDEGLLLSFPRPFRPRGLLGHEPTEKLMNGFFLFKTPGHPLLQLALDVATENIERRTATRVHKVTGPWVFSILRWLDRLGSLETASKMTANRQFGQLVDVAIQAVGDSGRLRQAFERLHITPLEAARDWFGRPPHRLRYKQSETHWINWQKQGREIFR